MKYKLTGILFFLYHFSILAQSSHQCNIPEENKKGNLEFIENKGQFAPQVLFKTELENHVLFLEKNCFTFNMVNTEHITHSHPQKDVKKTLSKEDLLIHGHAYRVNFLNANSNPTINSYYQPPIIVIILSAKIHPDGLLMLENLEPLSTLIYIKIST